MSLLRKWPGGQGMQADRSAFATVFSEQASQVLFPPELTVLVSQLLQIVSLPIALHAETNPSPTPQALQARGEEVPVGQ